MRVHIRCRMVYLSGDSMLFKERSEFTISEMRRRRSSTLENELFLTSDVSHTVRISVSDYDLHFPIKI